MNSLHSIVTKKTKKCQEFIFTFSTFSLFSYSLQKKDCQGHVIKMLFLLTDWHNSLNVIYENFGVDHISHSQHQLLDNVRVSKEKSNFISLWLVHLGPRTECCEFFQNDPSSSLFTNENLS